MRNAVKPTKQAGRLAATSPLFVAVTIFGLTYGLSAPLIALRLAQEGYSALSIGLNAAMHAFGVVVIAPLLPALCRRYAPRSLMCTALLAVAALLVAFPLLPTASWFMLRMLTGMASEVILVVSETWLNQTSDDNHRGRNLALYTAMLSLGFALGPLLLSWCGSNATAFFLAALISLAAAALLRGGRAPAFIRQETAGHHWRHWLALIPLVLLATVLNAALESAGMNLLAVYAISLGWGEAQATSLIAILLAGAILIQLPIGWLADRIDRRKLLVVLGLFSSVGALIWPMALGAPWFARVLLFCWGGVFVGIYTVAIALVGARFSGADLAGVYAVLSVGWGAGALVGPALGGMAMSLTPHGLPLMAALLCALFTLYAWRADPQRL